MDIHWQISTFDELKNTELYALLRLRQEVFTVEQDCAFQDIDNLDQDSIHMLGWRGEELIAYQRCLPPGVAYRESSIGRIVVHIAGRGTQLGRELVQRGIDYNSRTWADADIKIAAQTRLQAFYISLGFAVSGEEYMEDDGILHIHMIKPQAER